LAKRGNLEAKIWRLVYAFDEQALAIAAACAAPNTRRAYATAYRAFGGFLRARYGTASRERSPSPRGRADGRARPARRR